MLIWKEKLRLLRYICTPRRREGGCKEERIMYERILVPLDGSVRAEQVIPHAKVLAKLSGAKLILLRILEPFPPVRSMSPEDLKIIKRHAREWAEEYFIKITADLQEEDIAVESIISEGRASVMIAKFAEQNDIDLILISSRGRTGITRWLMGSVADRVIRGASVPVLLVPSSGDDDLESGA
jgi:nucleotide-binding universal stress UspA family protein